MSDDEAVKAVRELDKRIAEVGAQRGGVLYDVQRIVSSIHHSLAEHTAADERASKGLERELAGMRQALQLISETQSSLSTAVATLTERSAHHERTLQSHELVLGIVALFGVGMFLIGKVTGWF